MRVATILVLFAFAAEKVTSDTCPSGGKIYEWGISEEGKQDVIAAHNKYRRMIMAGKVSNQPRGKNIFMLRFDNNLAYEGRKVSKTCQSKHVLATDDRFNWVGQNLYISWSSSPSSGQDWNEAVDSWFDEHENFIYPDQSTGGMTGHYTQVVWGKTKWVGCDFISFYDYNQPAYPYAKLYTCNYGPGGNYNGEPPYERA